MNAGERKERWQGRTRRLKANLYALYLAYRDPRIPWYTKILAACVVAYALSPIDLIPDFIPVLGYLDDLILVPLGIALVLKMIPGTVLDEYRGKTAEAFADNGPRSWIAGVIVLLIWLLFIASVMVFLGRLFGEQ